MSYFSDDQAVEIWIAKWLGETKQSLIARYEVNNFRLYEVWTEERNVGTRERAWREFVDAYPHLATTVDPSPHVVKRRIVPMVKVEDQQQLSLL